MKTQGPRSVVLSPTNEKMNDINAECIQKFKPNEPILESYSKNWVNDEDTSITKEQMEDFNPGFFPPHRFQTKPGAPGMILRNLDMDNGLANGTVFRTIELSPKGTVLKVELLTGPRVEKPLVILFHIAFNL